MQRRARAERLTCGSSVNALFSHISITATVAGPVPLDYHSDSWRIRCHAEGAAGHSERSTNRPLGCETNGRPKRLAALDQHGGLDVLRQANDAAVWWFRTSQQAATN